MRSPYQRPPSLSLSLVHTVLPSQAKPSLAKIERPYSFTSKASRMCAELSWSISVISSFSLSASLRLWSGPSHGAACRRSAIFVAPPARVLAGRRADGALLLPAS